MTTQRCIFCRGSPVTKEHVLGKWISRLLASLEEGFQGFGFVGQFGRFAPEQKPLRRKYGSVHLTAQVACARCNNGWMSRLENTARRWLKPMIEGKPVDLPPEAQPTLARWAVKTAIVIQHMDLPPDSRYLRLDWLPAGEDPPAGVWVGLAAYVGLRQGASSELQAYRSDLANPGAAEIAGELFAVRIGRVVVLTFAWEGPEHRWLEVAPAARSAIVQVWPPSRLIRTWPPTSGIDDEGLASLSDGFYAGIFAIKGPAEVTAT